MHHACAAQGALETQPPARARIASDGNKRKGIVQTKARPERHAIVPS